MFLNPLKKESDSDDENRGEDWEMLSGSKSLTSMTDHTNNKEKEDEGEKDETWYKTIPATPTNTPVETPSAPVYPTQQDANTGGVNLPPIKEEHQQPPRFDEEYTPSTSEDEQYLECVERAVESVIEATGRVFLYVVVIVMLKWLVSTVWRKIKSIRA